MGYMGCNGYVPCQVRLRKNDLSLESYKKEEYFFQNIQKLYHNLVRYVVAIIIEKVQETVDRLWKCTLLLSTFLGP